MTLLPEARYDQVMTAFGGRGFLVRTPEELRSALELSLSDWEKPSLLNVLIDPSSDRKQQVISVRGVAGVGGPGNVSTAEARCPLLVGKLSVLFCLFFL